MYAMAEPASVRARLALYRSLARQLGQDLGREVVLIARMAGQYAKPRSELVEQLADGQRVPTYRGDGVNGLEPTEPARRSDPWRLLASYDRAADTLRIAAERPDRVKVFVSHEALLRDYEEPLTRGGAVAYASSGHLVWIGDRTRHPEGWHVGWAALLANPVGLKLGPTVTRAELADLVNRLDPAAESGRLSLISRMGADRVVDGLARLSRAVGPGEAVWQCDPMHGNTRRDAAGKYRRMQDIRAEVTGFVHTLSRFGRYPGGLHLEVTAQDVQECRDGPPPEGGSRPAPPCDPRLNPGQAAEIVAHFADEIRRCSRMRG
jgi:3-deoxy-7-phosphoheptulonate synthase